MSKILILTNHSYMLYHFRLELIQELMKSHEVVLSIDDLSACKAF